MTDVTKTDHGPLFDRFSERASHAHGGSYYDTGFGAAALNEAHGRLYDLFGAPKDSDAHGERYDDFGWSDMPVVHGQFFDSDFKAPAAGTSEHGDWFDVFRGGRTQARYMFDGKDYEGTVLECNREFATVKSTDGQTHEVSLAQFLAYRTPNEQQAAPSIPASDAHAPSAHSADAHGGKERDGDGIRGTFNPDHLPSIVEEAPQGQYREPRSEGIPAGLMDTFTHLKSVADELDVTKDVDTTETAAQGSPAAKSVGHRANCPRGGSGPCGADVDGKCSSCGESVRDHEAVGKAFGAAADPNPGGQGVVLDLPGSKQGRQATTDPPDVKVPKRDTKTSDHHMQFGAKTRRCPHCDQVIDELDEQASQGQPSRQSKQGGAAEFSTVTHKCIAGGLDVLKNLGDLT